MNIAIFGGTFNPIHNEHISLAKNSVKELFLDKLFVVPTLLPPHKDTKPLSATDRLNMLRLAFLSEEKIEVSDFEINNGGKSYSYITCEHFRTLYPDANLYLIVGGDMLENFKFWKNPERILKNVKLAVFSREDFAVDFNSEHDYFKKNFNADFIELKYNGKEQSSTEIRVYNKLKLPVSGMTDDKVIEYIKTNNLYSGGKLEQFVIDHLTEKRLIHTANVIVTALKKCKELSLNEEKVYTSALLHDVAKYLDYKSFKDFTLEKDVPSPVIHSFLGGYVAKNILGIQDEEIIDAITYHTSGKPNMTTLGKLIFVADMIEKGRNYEGVDKLREYYKESLDKCFIKCLEEEIVHLLNKKEPIYKKTLEAYEYYKNK